MPPVPVPMSATRKPRADERHQREEPRGLVEQLRAERVPALGLLVEERFGLGATAGHDPLDVRREPELDRAPAQLGPHRPLEERIARLDAVVGGRPLLARDHQPRVAQRRKVSRNARAGPPA